MGLLGDLKKIIFGTKSVAKSGFEKVKEEGGELVDSALEKGQDFAEVAAKKGEEIKDRLEDKLDNLVESFTRDKDDITITEKDLPAIEIPDAPSLEATQTTSTVSRTTDKLEDVASDIGEKTLEIGRDIADKAEVLGKKAADKFGEAANKLGDKIHEGKDALVDKAKEAAQKIEEKLDETVEKAKELEAKIDAENNDKDGDGFADKPADLGGSLLEGTDDFFSKAEKFAKGENISENTRDIKITKESAPDKPEYKSYGFEDRDGDGNEVVDDAIMVEDDGNEEKKRAVEERERNERLRFEAEQEKEKGDELQKEEDLNTEDF